MENITNEILEEAAKVYKQMGVSPDAFLTQGKVKNIYDFLGIKPEVDESGKRVLTPYEILGVLPNIVGNVEKPIVFFIRNKLKNLKPVKTAQAENFIFSKEKNKKDDSLVEFVLNSYRLAITQNNLAEAERYFDMLNQITGGNAKHYIGSVYDYTKFYRQMKKQLLIDLFSHFFLLYLMQKKSLIKKGLIIKNKKFKAYNSNKQVNLHVENQLPEIKSIRIDEIVQSEKEIPTPADNILQEDFSKSQPAIEDAKIENRLDIKLSENKSESLQKKSFIKRIRTHLQRKNKQRQAKQSGQEMAGIFEKEETIKEKEVSYE